MAEKRGKMSLAQVVAFGLAACLLYGVGAGMRSDVGILLQPIEAQTGLSYDMVSFCIAVMQLSFGASQPLFGLLASRRSNRFVLVLGALLLACGLLGVRAATSFPALLVSLGIVFGLGTGAISFGLVFTSAAYFVGQDYAMLVSGMLNAAAGMTGFVFAPLLNHLLGVGGLGLALAVMAVVMAIAVPVAFVVTSRDPRPLSADGKAKGAKGAKDAKGTSAGGLDVRALVREAASNRTYRLLIAGFSTCGFHTVIIESHLFSQFVSYGIPGDAASWAFSVYGIATIVGALLSGALSTRVRKGRLLAACYGFRAVWTVLYLAVMPKNVFTAVLFAIGLGMTGDATVSPTSGLVNENFSIGKVATLVGFLFLCHQIGAFCSAWAGGILVQATGSYVGIWTADVALCAFAAIMSWLIDRKPAGRER